MFGCWIHVSRFCPKGIINKCNAARDEKEGLMPSMEFHGRNFCRYHVLIFENDRVRESDMETLQFVGSSASHFVDDISVKVDFLHLIDMHLAFDLIFCGSNIKYL